MKKIIKKLNNFRFTAFLAAIFGVVICALSLTSFILYHFAGEINERGFRLVGFSDKPIVGFFYFMFVLITIILSIVVVYLAFPAIRNKDKVTPSKALLYVLVVAGAFMIPLFILSIVLVVSENPNTAIGFKILFPLDVIAIVGSILFLIPAISCHFYMPEIKK